VNRKWQNTTVEIDLLVFIPLGLLMLWIFTRVLLASQAIILEGQPLLAGLRRSWCLTHIELVRTMAIVVLTGILTWLLAVIKVW
jgi:hypothetical protein